MATIIIIPLALIVCGFITIAFTIDNYVKNNHRQM